MPHDGWLDLPHPSPHAPLRVFCFPHAGAGPAPYRLWSSRFGADVEVCLVCLPGRERRRHEPLERDLPRLVEAALPHLEQACRPRPFVFFGHSMGAVVAYEVARALQIRHGLSPRRLFLSARGPDRRSDDALHRLADEALLATLGDRYNGLPSALLADRELVDFFLPILRADLELIETHDSPPHPLLDCPITAIGGRDDPGAPPDSLRRWQSRTRADFELHTLAGDHFYLFAHPDAVFDVVRPHLGRPPQPPRRIEEPMICVAFPGQGSQRKGMGAELFDRFPDMCRTADAVLGCSIRELCLDDAGGRLKQTQWTQPALFTVNAMTYLASGVTPSVLAGHSLGEYNALLAAGCFDFETGLRLVQRRGALMGQAANGAMAAVVGLEAAVVQQVVDAHAPEVDLANFNAPDQVVLSGPAPAIARLEAPMQAAGARFMRLNVSAAFHSRYMAEAAAAYAQFLEAFRFDDPAIPVIANVTAQPYAPGQVARLLAEQIRRPVRWSDTIDELRHRGVTELVEAGPGRVLTGLWRSACGRPPGPRPMHVEVEVPASTRPVHGTASGAPIDTQAADPTSTRPVHDNAPAAPPEDTSTAAPAHGAAPLAVPRNGQATHHAAAPRGGTAESLGASAFREAYGVRWAYLAGTCAGLGAPAAVRRLARAGLLGFVGTSALSPDALAAVLDDLTASLGRRFGVNLSRTPEAPEHEARLVEQLVRRDVRFVEATGFLEPTPSLVACAFGGAREGAPRRRMLVRVSRPDVAASFLRPTDDLVEALLGEGRLTAAEAEMARRTPLATDLCVEADAAEGSLGPALLPAVARLRDELAPTATVGAAGGLGSPEAVAAAFLLGADFVLTASVNLCTPESPLSETARDMLADLDLHDTGYAPALEMFEAGARTQVARKGTLFCARANRLYELYRQHASLDEIDARTREGLERSYFRMPLEAAWREARERFVGSRPAEVERAERVPRQKMALLFKHYLQRGVELAIEGDPACRVDYQLPAGPGLGAFNRLVRGSALEPWRERHVDLVAERLMQGAATFLHDRLRRLVAADRA